MPAVSAVSSLPACVCSSAVYTPAPLLGYLILNFFFTVYTAPTAPTAVNAVFCFFCLFVSWLVVRHTPYASSSCTIDLLKPPPWGSLTDSLHTMVMDPVGTGIGATSLVIHLLDGCFKGWYHIRTFHVR